MNNPKAKTKAAPKKTDPNHLQLAKKPESESDNDYMARTITAPAVRGAITNRAFSGQLGEIHLTSLVAALSQENKKASEGDLSRAEALLMTQAHTLDAIFNELARRAALNMGEYMDATERYMRLALKAQNQCRATLETLATVKNPPMVFAKQANIANGPQQINNGQPVPACEKTVIEQDKLLEHQHGEWLDPGTASAASGVDTQLEALGAINGA